ncbi:MAG TPA: CorA family divalent cation transporter [Devosia sp.]|nr:CorA family divalent cation transporter [Devosia sp.]
MDGIAQPADGKPRKSYPTVREATEFPATAYRFDGKGNVEEIGFADGPLDGPDKGFVLIAGSLSSPEFKRWLAEHLEGAAAEGLTATDQHARCTVVDDRALVVLRILRSRTDPDDLSRQTMSIWLERNRVIIASKLALGELINLPQWQKSRHAPVSPADLIARMGTRAADRIEPLVEHLGDVLDSIEDDMMSERDEQSRQRLTRLRRSLINLRRLLWPQRDVLNTLEIEDLSFLTARDRARLREASARSARLGDELQVLAERAALIHEQVLDTRAEQMNKTILVLTAATVVAMPMTVVSGLLGMNVAGIPFAENPEAFWFVVVGLAALGAGIVWFMRARKWL